MTYDMLGASKYIPAREWRKIGQDIFTTCINIVKWDGVKQLAGDMHKFSRFDKKLKGPTVTHMWYTTGFSTLLIPRILGRWAWFGYALLLATLYCLDLQGGNSCTYVSEQARINARKFGANVELSWIIKVQLTVSHRSPQICYYGA